MNVLHVRSWRGAGWRVGRSRVDDRIHQFRLDLRHRTSTVPRNPAERTTVRHRREVQCLVQDVGRDVIRMCDIAYRHPPLNRLVAVRVPIDRVADRPDRVIAREGHYRDEQRDQGFSPRSSACHSSAIRAPGAPINGADIATAPELKVLHKPLAFRAPGG